MLKSFWGTFFSEESNTSHTENISIAKPNSTYSTQGEMLKALGKEEEDGLCNPLTNLFAKNQITGTHETDVLSKTNKAAYLAAVLEENHQDELRRKGADGKHSAFVDTQTPFEVQSIPAGEVPNLKVDAVLPTPGHAIITFPVEDPAGSDAYHQVYLGKISDTDCVSFDAEREGGRKKGNCQELFNDFVKSMSTRQDRNRPPKVVTVATTSFFSSKTAEKRDHQTNLTPNCFYS